MSELFTVEDGVRRAMTDQEKIEHEQLLSELKSRKTATEQKAATRAAALAKLGLTADEIAALFG